MEKDYLLYTKYFGIKSISLNFPYVAQLCASNLAKHIKKITSSFGVDYFLPLLLFVLFFSCNNNNQKIVASNSTPISHEIWDELLQKHIVDGKVNYKEFAADKVRFDEYLNLLNTHHPNDKNWSKNEQLAYWINAYNAYTVELIVDNYPVESIKDIKKGLPFLNSVWDIEFIEIEGNTYDLNHIEHEILRKDFDEPRIHFAIVCASISCPNLWNKAFTADQIDAQLTTQARAFINDKTKNNISPNDAQLSKIFSWFKSDFTKKTTLLDYLNQYSDTQISPDAKVSYLSYDWGLNE